jgi:hypothetical protein
MEILNCDGILFVAGRRRDGEEGKLEKIRVKLNNSREKMKRKRR